MSEDDLRRENRYLQRRLDLEKNISKRTLALQEALQKITSLPKSADVETAIRIAYSTLERFQN